ncbi:hypothetical protein [Macrococcoides caseolyticum]|uniref:hypothetical protein n=1 Tax=Macrococcoides caseolyticum TaxID=69966 RepID=UPI001F2F885A|nr:hypothetical protein [Macrococcus caseolyticus]MCE4957268.1 hypothetical protein [Macrococcus caseolyticus]
MMMNILLGLLLIVAVAIFGQMTKKEEQDKKFDAKLDAIRYELDVMNRNIEFNRKQIDNVSDVINE